MKRKSTIPAILAALALCSAAYSQEYTYMEFLPEDGYPSKINCIDIEASGLVWLGSDDGLYSLLSQDYYIRYSTDGFPLPSNDVRKLVNDSNGCLWILTDKGFVGIKSDPEDGSRSVITGLDGSTPAYSATVKQDIVYFGCEGRIVTYDHRSGEFKEEVSLNAGTPFPITDMISVAGNSWNDLVLLSKGADTYFIYNIATQEIRKTASALSDRIITGFGDSNGELWLSLFRNGVVRINRAGETNASYNTSNSLLTSDVVLCFEERDGDLWLGTEGGGINILDPLSGEIISSTYGQGGPLTIPTSTVTALYSDHNGHMWCGKKNGGAFVIVQPQIACTLTSEVEPRISPDGFNCFYQDGADKLVWIGTPGSGLLSFDTASQKFSAYPSTAGLNIFSIASLDGEHLILSCPNRGGFIFDKAGGRLREASVIGSIYSSNLSNDEPYIVNDTKGRVLIFGDEVRRWDNRTNIFENIGFPEDVYREGNFRPVLDSYGEYITDDVNLYRISSADQYRYELVSAFDGGQPITCAAIDAYGTIWLAKGKDIYRYEPVSGESCLEYTMEDDVMAIINGPSGRLWIGVRNSLVVINPQNDEMAKLTAVDGVRTSDFKQGAMLKTGNGELVLGGQSGLVLVNPSFRFSTAKGQGIRLMSVSVDGEIVDNQEKFTIPASNSSIDINFFSKGTDILKTSIYHMTLSNMGVTELEETSSRPHLHLTRLEPGLHTLSISTTEMDGSWTRSSDVCTFRVERPWYSTWWCIALLVLLLLGAAGAVILRNVKVKEERQSKQINDERYNFLINVSHELRTPLTLISGPLRRYIKTHPELDEASRTTISKVCLQADRMTNLLNTVLTTNKIQEGADKVVPVPTRFNDWLFGCVDQFYDEATGLKMDILLFPDTSIGEVSMDERLCGIVLSNIISNALKHNEPGTPLTVWDEWNEDNGTVRVNVKDHGCGIGQVDVSQLFERYYQATEEHTGFGIGLSYSKAIIDAHHGFIGAYNNLNDKGATFWFELPAGPESRISDAGTGGLETFADLVSEVRMLEESALATGSTQPVAEKPEKPQAPKKNYNIPLDHRTVLFVDDDKDLRDYVTDELAQYCGCVLEAVNGKNALAVLEANDVDIIVSDVMMPEMDGLEFCRRVKGDERFAHIPVILLTARADEKTKMEGDRAKADYYMPKPFDIDNLVEVMKSK